MEEQTNACVETPPREEHANIEIRENRVSNIEMAARAVGYSPLSFTLVFIVVILLAIAGLRLFPRSIYSEELDSYKE